MTTPRRAARVVCLDDAEIPGAKYVEPIFVLSAPALALRRSSSFSPYDVGPDDEMKYAVAIFGWVRSNSSTNFRVRACGHPSASKIGHV